MRGEKTAQIGKLRSASRDHASPDVCDPNSSAGLLVVTAIHEPDLTRWLPEDKINEVTSKSGGLINHAHASVGLTTGRALTLRKCSEDC